MSSTTTSTTTSTSTSTTSTSTSTTTSTTVTTPDLMDVSGKFIFKVEERVQVYSIKITDRVLR